MGVSNVELWNVVLAAKQNLLKELVSGDIIFCLNVSQISTFVCALTFNHGQINYKRHQTSKCRLYWCLIEFL
jgi:hypothetical protein